MYRHRSLFGRLARRTSRATGHPLSFAIALAMIILWAVTGPLFGFSDRWQLVINSATTIATFLMIFLLQNTQNRDNEAMQLKLDELIRSIEGAHNTLLDLEELEEEDLDRYRERYEALAREARRELRKGRQDVDSPDLKPEPGSRRGKK